MPTRIIMGGRGYFCMENYYYYYQNRNHGYIMRTKKFKAKLAKQTFSEAFAPGEKSKIGMKKNVHRFMDNQFFFIK